MEGKLQRLYNTMLGIETKGNSTKTMADCLRYLEQMILEERNKQASNGEKKEIV